MHNQTLATLQEGTGITDKQLDGRVEERHLVKLVGLFGHSERFVGVPGLELNEAQEADVKDAVIKYGHEMDTCKALTLWMKRLGTLC